MFASLDALYIRVNENKRYCVYVFLSRHHNTVLPSQSITLTAHAWHTSHVHLLMLCLHTYMRTDVMHACDSVLPPLIIALTAQAWHTLCLHLLAL